MTAHLLFKKVSLLYFNVWPEQGRGYNSFESATEKIKVFDRALEGVSALRPDMILIACNTLSALYYRTLFSCNTCTPAPNCYSLGNFVFYQPTDLFYRKVGYLVKAGLSKGGVVHLKLIPYGIHDQGLRLLESGERDRFFKKMLAISEPLDDLSGVEKAWYGFLHYYGKEGLKIEIQTILEKMDADPPKGAAMLRNRLTTMQHNQHWIDTLTRVMNNDLETSATWAFDLAAEWLTFTGK